MDLRLTFVEERRLDRVLSSRISLGGHSIEAALEASPLREEDDISKAVLEVPYPSSGVFRGTYLFRSHAA